MALLEATYEVIANRGNFVDLKATYEIGATQLVVLTKVEYGTLLFRAKLPTELREEFDSLVGHIHAEAYTYGETGQMS